MGIVFLLYASVILFIINKKWRFDPILRSSFRFPVSNKEKEIIKQYYGVKDLPSKMAEYKNEVFHDTIISFPLLFIGLLEDISLFIVGIAITSGISRLGYTRRKKIVENWKVEFFKEYPGFLNRLKLYLQTGLTLENALSNCFKGEIYGYYLMKLKLVLEEISHGRNRREAYMDIILETRNREIIKLVNFFLQFYLIGGGSISYLDQLSENAWKLKKETVRRMAEEGSAKMVFPMMLIFIGICLLVIVPSILAFINAGTF